MRSSSASGSYVAGIVGDEVTSVYVGDRRAALQNNVFLTDSESVEESIVMVAGEETREISLRTPPGQLPTDPQVELPRYLGQIQYGPGRRLTVEIDDVDAPDWRGIPRVILLTSDASGTSIVDVQLLEGPRAGYRARADLVIDRDSDPAVVFVGKSAFA